MIIHAEPGEPVYQTAIRAIQYASQHNDAIQMSHNDVTVNVYPESHLHDILEKFDLRTRLKRATAPKTFLMH